MATIPVLDRDAQTPAQPVRLLSVQGGQAIARDDQLATEEALEIHVAGTAPVITMRTPGHDLELTAGLLLSEGLLQHPDDLATLQRAPYAEHVVNVRLRRFTDDHGRLLNRSSLSNSACGVCGKDKLNLELLHARPPLPPGPRVRQNVLLSLPERLRAAQGLFAATGGLHAAALFDGDGSLQLLREDVGRHNALDKVMGRVLLDGGLPLHDRIVLLSGRASFELIAKCVMSGAPVVCAISAPSSYAVSLAREFGVTLVGFLRDRRFNVYAVPERIEGLDGPPA